jgi:hypothetical protein
MPELHSNGSYDPYIAQLFNPLGGGGQFNPALYGAAGANGIGGVWGAGQTPWATQTPAATQTPLGSPIAAVQQGPNVAQSLLAVQIAQQIVARQAAQAIQCAQALQTLLQQALSQIAGAPGQIGMGQFGMGQYGSGQFGGQQQTLQQLMQYLATPQQPPFRYGLAV